MQGQQVVYAARGEDLKTADISALGAIDGISAVYPIDGDTFTVTGGRTETFVNEDTSKGYLFACELPAAQASDCQTGLSAVIKQGDQTETAAITAISENAENDTVDITIQLTATDWKVGPADAEIVLSEQDYDLCLPNTTIHQDNQGDFVFAVEEKNTVLGTQNVLVRIPVTVLEVGQSQTSIEGAISPEDSIVVQSTRSLEAGSKVRVKNENA